MSSPKRWSKIWVIVLAGVLLAANVLFDHYRAPTGMLLSPLAAAGMTGLVMFYGPVMPPSLQTGLCALLLALQDIGIKLTGGGSHDAVGQSLVNLMVLVGALLSLVIIAGALWRQKRLAVWHRVGAFLLFPLLLLLHLALFAALGQGRYIIT